MDILANLNPQQRAAVEYVDGPLLILAGPGSGKTRVVTHRIAYLIGHRGVRPYNIMAVTFTNKAAREMLERLKTLVPTDVERITIGTFHAICSQILRRDGWLIGLDSRFLIYDEKDQLDLIRKVLGELNLDEKVYQPRVMLNHISAAKSELISPFEYAEYARNFFEEIVSRIYRHYQAALLANNGLDFDDLLMTTVRLFREQPPVLEKYQHRYVHLLVDEFQDTNPAQYALVKMLGTKHRNVCAVGDEDQSIYSWRKADIRNIFKFEVDFPETKVVFLEQNYRSTKTILDAARSVIAANLMRREKQLWTRNPGGLPIIICEARDEEEEAEYVVSEIEHLIRTGNYRLRDIAVMYRANAQSRVLERVFVRRKMPHKLVGVRFYQRQEIKDVLAYLRVIYNPFDTISFRRIINVPPRGLGSRTLSELDRWSDELGIQLWDALHLLRGDKTGSDANGKRPAANPFNARATAALLSALSLFEELIAESRRLSLPKLIELVLTRSGYAEHLMADDMTAEDRWENIKELFTVASRYAQLEPQTALAAFLEEVALATDVDEYDDKENAVTLITLHGAKGLEFRVVFIVGMEEGLCPHSRSLMEPSAMEEERRLCYVGMTRAKEMLQLVYTRERAIYGATCACVPSRFIADIPRHLVRFVTSGIEPPTAAQQMRAGTSLSKMTSSANLIPPLGREETAMPKLRPNLPKDLLFKPGDRVRHPKFGEGIVVSSSLLADDQEVSVAFPEIGVKKLSLSFAPLEKIDPSGASGQG